MNPFTIKITTIKIPTVSEHPFNQGRKTMTGARGNALLKQSPTFTWIEKVIALQEIYAF